MPVPSFQKAHDRLAGRSNYAEMKMEIVRPDWKREVTIKAWSESDVNSLIYITAPARDKGIGFLKKGREIWNWQPKIDRAIKLPPSMMSQSWMGSDLSNDDLVQQSSIIDDFTHKLVGTETIEGRSCYVIELKAKPDAPTVWGKIKTWVG